MIYIKHNYSISSVYLSQWISRYIIYESQVGWGSSEVVASVVLSQRGKILQSGATTVYIQPWPAWQTDRGVHVIDSYKLITAACSTHCIHSWPTMSSHWAVSVREVWKLPCHSHTDWCQGVIHSVHTSLMHSLVIRDCCGEQLLCIIDYTKLTPAWVSSSINSIMTLVTLVLIMITQGYRGPVQFFGKKL